jgi:hypothetical protein
MRNAKRVASAVLAGLALASCQTITEQMPTSATGGTSPVSGVTPIPVIVVPVPVPVPVNPAPVPAPGPPSNPVPTSPTNPNPTNPAPTTPEVPNNNNSSVVRIGAKVYFIERGGQILPGSEGATEAQVGDRIHLDATAKDASNLPTNTHGAPHWSFSDTGVVSISGGNGDWTPVMLVRHPGSISAYVEADGVRSNTVSLSLH